MIDYFQHTLYVQYFLSLFHVKILLLDAVNPNLNDFQKRSDEIRLRNDAIGLRLGEVKIFVDPKLAVALLVEANAGIVKYVEFDIIIR